MRLVPMSPESSSILKAYLKSNKIDRGMVEEPLFVNRSGNKLTRPGVTYILQKYVSLCQGEKS